MDGKGQEKGKRKDKDEEKESSEFTPKKRAKNQVYYSSREEELRISPQLAHRSLPLPRPPPSPPSSFSLPSSSLSASGCAAEAPYSGVLGDIINSDSVADDHLVPVIAAASASKGSEGSEGAQPNMKQQVPKASSQRPRRKSSSRTRIK